MMNDYSTPTLTAQMNGHHEQSPSTERPNLPRQRSRHFDRFQPPASMYTLYNGAMTGTMSPILYSSMPTVDKPGNYFAEAADWGFAKPTNASSATLPLAAPSRLKNNSTFMNQRSPTCPLPAHWADVSPPESNGSLMSSSRPATRCFSQDGGIRGEEEIIPTAIVIKNIPFAVKKEQLLEVMTQLNIPLPYAFNYHFDDRGVFRGLSFANFSAPEEATLVVNTLNDYEIAGRRLRVEYKKMLPAHERERIEREKQERRGQLLEQHMSSAAIVRTGCGGLQTMPNGAKSPLTGAPLASPAVDLNLNDPETLELYSRILLFKDDATRSELAFPPSLSAHQRRTVHVIASKFGLYRVSRNEGDECVVYVTRRPPGMSQPEWID